MSEDDTEGLDFDVLQAMAPPRKVAAGEILSRAGDRGTEMYIVLSGKLQVTVGSTMIEEVGPGDIVGEMALIDSSARSADVVAATPAEVIAVDEATFLLLVEKTPYFALDVMRTLVRRLRAANARLSG